MRKIALIAALALASPAWAQADKPAAEKPAAAQEAPKAEAPKSEAPKAEKKRGSAAKRQQDARHCLEKATNTEIIKCAEAYL